MHPLWTHPVFFIWLYSIMSIAYNLLLAINHIDTSLFGFPNSATVKSIESDRFIRNPFLNGR